MSKTLRKLPVIAVIVIVIAIVAAPFDPIIVLGTPAEPDGTPSPEQRKRALEGIREYKAGVAPNLIFTGGPAHNQYVEAHVMTTLALAQGVPSNAILEEGRAQNTIQNIFYSQRIMAAHHWNSAEVVSSPSTCRVPLSSCTTTQWNGEHIPLR